jgi:hypothetical protein
VLREYGDDAGKEIGLFDTGSRPHGTHPQRTIPGKLQQPSATLSRYGVALHT